MHINKIDELTKSWLIKLGQYIQENTEYSVNVKQDYRD